MKSVHVRIAHLIKKYEELTGTILSIGTVESATGGGIGDKLTNVPGSSVYYKGSIVSYSNEIKARIAGVTKNTLKSCGAVSYGTGLEMAQGGRKLLGVDICIADTGIAGPTGATAQKPVGFFYIAISCSDGFETCKDYNFKGNRLSIKKQATVTALELIEDYLNNKIKGLTDKDYPQKQVVTSFITHNNKLLIVKRSQKVGTYRGRWSAISGYLELKPLAQAYKEIKEETGLTRDKLTLIKRGRPLILLDDVIRTKWNIYPFYFSSKTGKITVDWENTVYKWISPDDIDFFPTVPGLKKAWERVMP